MSIGYTDLKKGILVVIDGAPCEILEANFLRMQQRKAVVQTKYRNLVTGKVLERNWQASDNFEEANIEKKDAQFIFSKEQRGARPQTPSRSDGGREYWFTPPGNPKDRFMLTEDQIGDGAKFLKPATIVEMTYYDEKPIKVTFPIKMEFKVIEAPPAIKGNTAQGGSKVVTLEGGAQISTPLFVNEGDVIRINTQTGEYVERVSK